MKKTDNLAPSIDALLGARVRPEPPQILKSLSDAAYRDDASARQENIPALEKRILEAKLNAQMKGYSEHGDIDDDHLYHRLSVEAHREAVEQDLENRKHVQLWLASEKTLGFLRSRGSSSPPDAANRQKALDKFVQHLDLTKFPEANPESPHFLGPGRKKQYDYFKPPPPPCLNSYYEETRPDLVQNHGFPFYATIPHVIDEASLPGPRWVPPEPPPEKIVGINTCFWTAYVGGDRRLRHDVIYFEPENRFYFFDLVADYYLPTSEAKIRLWLAHTLVELVWGQLPETAQLILQEFIAKPSIDEILSRAKALLAADDTFFNGPNANPRFVEKEALPTQSDHEVWISEFVSTHVAVSDGVLPVAKCLNLAERWYKLNQFEIPKTKELKGYLEHAILKAYGRTVRNDLKFAESVCARGWKGLRLHIPRPESSRENQATAPGQLSGPSNVSAPP